MGLSARGHLDFGDHLPQESKIRGSSKSTSTSRRAPFPSPTLVVWPDSGHLGFVRHWGEVLEAVLLRARRGALSLGRELGLTANVTSSTIVDAPFGAGRWRGCIGP